MKIGIEAEGRLKGIPTAFMEAEEFLELQRNLLTIPAIYTTTNDPDHYYISDHKGIITYDVVDKFLNYFNTKYITLEVKKLPPKRYKWSGRINFMLHLDGAEQIFELEDRDQIKWVSKDNDVMSVSINEFEFTECADFYQDVVLSRKGGK